VGERWEDRYRRTGDPFWQPVIAGGKQDHPASVRRCQSMHAVCLRTAEWRSVMVEYVFKRRANIDADT
jgi:hypothetical protein